MNTHWELTGSPEQWGVFPVGQAWRRRVAFVLVASRGQGSKEDRISITGESAMEPGPCSPHSRPGTEQR